MENENKNENRSENKNKNRPHRHKSYFISPNPNQENSNEQKVTNEAPFADSKPKNKNKNKNRNKNQNQNQNFQKQEQAPATQSTSSITATDANNINSNNNNNKSQNSDKSKRKNKHKKHFDNAQKEPQSNRNDFSTQTEDEDNELDLSFPKFDRLEKPAPKKLESFASSPEFQKYQDYEEFTYDQIYGSLDEKDETDKADKADKTEEKSENSPIKPATENSDSPVDEIQEEKPVGLVEVVGIRFKSSGKTYYFTPNNINLRVGLHAVVETARGLEYGEVVMANTFISEDEIIPPLRPVVRASTQADDLHNEEIKKLEESAFHICNEKIIAHNLDMKLIDAQYTFDNSKLLFYFTSSGRVDFRELVKDLASVFRTRIELRQIGIRDEAKMVGGLGICGRPLCCSKFLTDFGQVTIKMAKEQNLSLNTTKISGICGRLMCCLRYEHETYEYEIKRTPPVDTLVRTVDGVGTVTDISPLQGTIKVRLAASPEVMPKSYKREEVTILKKKN